MKVVGSSGLYPRRYPTTLGIFSVKEAQIQSSFASPSISSESSGGGMFEIQHLTLPSYSFDAEGIAVEE
jgi:hypothetical protein